jgi:CelD/BcsL family acetyltransferase involved in cellulose biosynthesis
VERDGELLTLAPLFADSGMIFFVGSGGSDYLDFIGDTSDPALLETLLATARAAVPDFLGFRFYHVPDASPTGPCLAEIAPRLGLVCYDEGELPAPALDLAADGGAGLQAANKRSLLRHERFFQRDGGLQVEHLTDAAAILAQLPEFFEQHRQRWAGTPFPSLFQDGLQRTFYERLTGTGPAAGWLRFTRVSWHGRAIAFHFGFSYQGSYLWYKPSFAIDLARRSPGEVLLRQLLLAAVDEGCQVFDFGLGDEAFKQRFATHTACVRTWGLYPGAQPRRA